MKSKSLMLLSMGAAPWKYMLLAVILAFSNVVPAHADDHEEAAPAAEEEAGPVDDYLELLEAQGEYAPAYDFSRHPCCGQ